MYSHIPILARGEGIHIDEHTFIISADLGQVQDYTAISVIDRVVKGKGVLNDLSYHLRHIERPPRGTEYPAIVDRLIELYESEPLQGAHKAVVIDITGLGRPVYDMMWNTRLKPALHGISITGGDGVHVQHKAVYGIPKRDLVTNLQLMLQNGTLKIAKGIKEASAFVEEMVNFQVKITASGNDVYGARSGMHDDIVLSVAMGAWLAQNHRYIRGRRW